MIKSFFIAVALLLGITISQDYYLTNGQKKAYPVYRNEPDIEYLKLQSEAILILHQREVNSRVAKDNLEEANRNIKEAYRIVNNKLKHF